MGKGRKIHSTTVSTKTSQKADTKNWLISGSLKKVSEVGCTWLH